MLGVTGWFLISKGGVLGAEVCRVWSNAAWARLFSCGGRESRGYKEKCSARRLTATHLCHLDHSPGAVGRDEVELIFCTRQRNLLITDLSHNKEISIRLPPPKKSISI